MTPVDPSRRRVIGLATAGLAGIVIAPGVTLFELAHARAPEASASAKVRWGLLIDANRCTPDCTACVGACAKENGLPQGGGATTPQWIRKVDLKDLATGRSVAAPVMCQHCASPPCVDVCPTGASFKRADGIVLVDRHTCIGCRYCMMACPYKARSFAGHRAIVFGDLNDPASEIARRVANESSKPLRADLRLAPGVRYQGI